MSAAALMGKLLRAPVTVATLAADRWLWPALLRAQGVRCEGRVELHGRCAVRMTERGEIRIGEGVKLFSRPWSNPLHLNSPCGLRLLQPGARISIGAGSGLSGTVICAATSVEIGERVLIGANCTIVDTDFHPLSAAARREHQTRGARSRPVSIGDDAFIGANSILLKGAVVGEGCVVGAGSVVTGEIPPHSIAAGNPAKVIRRLDAAPNADSNTDTNAGASARETTPDRTTTGTHP